MPLWMTFWPFLKHLTQVCVCELAGYFLNSTSFEEVSDLTWSCFWVHLRKNNHSRTSNKTECSDCTNSHFGFQSFLPAGTLWSFLDVFSILVPETNIYLFHWTFMLEFYGLSRFGRFFAGLCGCGTPQTTYDRKRKEVVDGYVLWMRDYMSSARPLMLCFDNYNKKFSSGKLSTKKDHAYDLTNCNVIGATRCEITINDSFLYVDGHNIFL